MTYKAAAERPGAGAPSVPARRRTLLRSGRVAAALAATLGALEDPPGLAGSGFRSARLELGREGYARFQDSSASPRCGLIRMRTSRSKPRVGSLGGWGA